MEPADSQGSGLDARPSPTPSPPRATPTAPATPSAASTPAPVPGTGALSPAMPGADHRVRRWRLFRDLLVFQVKLLVDGLKDLVFAPVALIVAMVGLVTHREDPGRLFYTLLRWGHGFDRWVNLFGTSEPRALPPTGSASMRDASSATPSMPSSSPHPGGATRSSSTVDAYVDRIEQVLADQVRRGGLTARAKDAIDEALDSLQQRRGGPPR